MYRILIDQDSTVYDLDTPWINAHNADYPNHIINREDLLDWDRSKACTKVSCAADIYSYFNNPEIWTNGAVLGNSDYITHKWQLDYNDVDLAFITTASNAMSMTYKAEWLQKHFPHIHAIMIVNTHIKHWVNADILIDDGVHNLMDFQGIRILYAQPWNNNARADYIVADGKDDYEKWCQIDNLVRHAIMLLDSGYNHSTIETIIRNTYENKCTIPSERSEGYRNKK